MLLFAIAGTGFDTALLAYAAWIWWGLRRPARRTVAQVRADVASRHQIPAAPDNQPGTNADLLWTCRRIAAIPRQTRKGD